MRNVECRHTRRVPGKRGACPANAATLDTSALLSARLPAVQGVRRLWNLAQRIQKRRSGKVGRLIAFAMLQFICNVAVVGSKLEDQKS